MMCMIELPRTPISNASLIVEKVCLILIETYFTKYSLINTISVKKVRDIVIKT